MNKKEIIELLNKEGVSDWNSYRKDNPDWIPDLEGLTLPNKDLGGINLQGANLRGTDLSRCKISTFWGPPKLTDAIYDAYTKWEDLITPSTWGAKFVSTWDDEKEATVKVFLSYAWTNKEVVLAIDQWLRNKNISTKIDERYFFAGARIRDEIIRVMQGCDVILIFYSNQSKDKPWPEFERELAQDIEMDAKTKGRKPPRIIYLVIDNLELPDIRERNRLAIMASERLFPDICEELYANIKGLIRTPKLIGLKKWDNYKF